MLRALHPCVQHSTGENCTLCCPPHRSCRHCSVARMGSGMLFPPAELQAVICVPASVCLSAEAGSTLRAAHPQELGGLWGSAPINPHLPVAPGAVLCCGRSPGCVQSINCYCCNNCSVSQEMPRKSPENSKVCQAVGREVKMSGE